MMRFDFFTMKRMKDMKGKEEGSDKISIRM